MAPGGLDRQQHRRRHRDRGRPAPRRLADAGPLPRLAGAAERVPAGAAVRRAGRGGRRSLRSTPHGHRRQPRSGARPVRPRRHHRRRLRQHRGGPDLAVRARHRRDLRGLREQHAPARPRRARGPRHRQRPDAGRLAADEPAAGPADRRVPVRGGHGPAVRDERGLFRTRCTPHLAGGHERETRAGRTIRLARRHGRGHPLARRPSADADPRVDHLPVQRHVRRGVVGDGPLRGRAAGHERRRIRPPDDGHGHRRDRGHRLVRPPRAALLARRHHASRAAHRDRHAPGASR